MLLYLKLTQTGDDAVNDAYLRDGFRMCGVAGFFVGCPLTEICDTVQPGTCRKIQLSKPKIFSNWYDRATVRSAPRRILDSSSRSLDLFPRDLVPFVQHPLIAQKYAERIHEILAYALFRYLTFTINLELIVVNRTTKRLLAGSCGISLEAGSRLDALRLYCDEAYHALFCADMLEQAQKMTGLEREEHSPAFLEKVRQLENGSQLFGIETLLFTIVSETLITASLVAVHKGKNAAEPITSLMLDHALDEARHHAFYKNILIQLIHTSPDRQKLKLAALIPAFILEFILPDKKAILADLKAVGINDADAHEIFAVTYSDDTVASYASSCAKDLITCLSELNLMHKAEVEDAFFNAGLL